MSAKTATYVKHLDNFTGEARLYRLDPPLEGAGHVAVSATTAPFTGPETYIFASDKEGNVINWVELEGSYRGGLDCEAALANAGYRVS